MANFIQVLALAHPDDTPQQSLLNLELVMVIHESESKHSGRGVQEKGVPILIAMPITGNPITLFLYPGGLAEFSKDYRDRLFQ